MNITQKVTQECTVLSRESFTLYKVLKNMCYARLIFYMKSFVVGVDFQVGVSKQNTDMFFRFNLLVLYGTFFKDEK